VIYSANQKDLNYEWINFGEYNYGQQVMTFTQQSSYPVLDVCDNLTEFDIEDPTTWLKEKTKCRGVKLKFLFPIGHPEARDVKCPGEFFHNVYLKANQLHLRIYLAILTNGIRNVFIDLDNIDQSMPKPNDDFRDGTKPIYTRQFYTFATHTADGMKYFHLKMEPNETTMGLELSEIAIGEPEKLIFEYNTGKLPPPKKGATNFP
jgi:hypothetical protein